MTEPISKPQAEARRARVAHLLETLGQKGFSQRNVAEQAGISGTYLADIKNGHRPLGELIARRLAEAFQVDHQWLMGAEGTIDSLPLGHEDDPSSLVDDCLPVFPHPVEGVPRNLAAWDGSIVKLSGAALQWARSALRPYVLRFGVADHTGRLRQNDLLLISQQVDAGAEVQVIKVRGKLYLARRAEDGSWVRLAKGASVSATCPVVGHAVGIVWGPLGVTEY